MIRISKEAAEKLKETSQNAKKGLRVFISGVG